MVSTETDGLSRFEESLMEYLLFLAMHVGTVVPWADAKATSVTKTLLSSYLLLDSEVTSTKTRYLILVKRIGKSGLDHKEMHETDILQTKWVQLSNSRVGWEVWDAGQHLQVSLIRQSSSACIWISLFDPNLSQVVKKIYFCSIIETKCYLCKSYCELVMAVTTYR